MSAAAGRILWSPGHLRVPPASCHPVTEHVVNVVILNGKDLLGAWESTRCSSVISVSPKCLMSVTIT
jgi:hypothetical protein